MKVVEASSELRSRFKRLPKGMTLDYEIIPDRTQPDTDDIRTEITRLWAGFDLFDRHFEKIGAHSLGAWVTDRHIFFEVFVPMYDTKMVCQQMYDIARKMKLVAKDAKPKLPMSVLFKDGTEKHGCMFLVEFHAPNLRDPF